MHVLEADIIKIKKNNIDLMSNSKNAFFQDMFQMTTIAFVSVINHFHINGLHLFWPSQYIYIYIYIYILPIINKYSQNIFK